MAGIAHVVVVTRVAGGGEGVMAAHRVLHDLNERFELAVEGLGWEARSGIAAA